MRSKGDISYTQRTIEEKSLAESVGFCIYLQVRREVFKFQSDIPCIALKAA